MMKRIETISSVLGLVLGLALLGQSSALALNNMSKWAESYKPLERADGTAHAWAYGWAWVDRTGNGTQQVVLPVVKTSGKRYSAYVEIDVQSNAGKCKSGSSYGFTFTGIGGTYGSTYSCTQPFYTFKKNAAQSERTRATGWTFLLRVMHKVNPNGTASRAAVKLCLDRPLWFDSCTNQNFSGADTY
jgi:hypothetical protein